MTREEFKWLFGLLLEPAGLSVEHLHTMFFGTHKVCLFYMGAVFGWFNTQTRTFKTKDGEFYHIYEEDRERMSQVLLEEIKKSEPFRM